MLKILSFLAELLVTDSGLDDRKGENCPISKPSVSSQEEREFDHEATDLDDLPVALENGLFLFMDGLDVM